MAKIKIAMIAPLAISIPPKKYGGSEFVIHYLTEGLVEKGYDVDLYATGDSITKANLIPMSKQGQWELAGNQDPDLGPYHLNMIFEVIEAASNYDIIHDHLGPLGVLLARECKTPVISTQHIPITEMRAKLFNKYRDNYNIISISNNQRKNYPDLNYAATVYNGIPVEDYTYNPSNENYLCFLGRFDKKKGAIEAIEVAKTTGNRLIMAARIEDISYYHKYIKPEIDGKKIIYIGEVNFKQKVKLLRNAKALLSLIQWEEPFGLVVPEANACGTPVIVNPRGAFPELVKNGINGFLTDNTIENAAKLVRRISEIDRSKCRKHVEEHFSVDIMIENYIEVYKKILAK